LFRRLLGGIVGLVLGACLGATILSVNRSPSAAPFGIAWGLGIGAVVGPLPLIMFVKMMDSLAPRRYTEGKIIDVKVVEPPNDEK
jgi:hypothetical protein